ncbi:DNA helicase MCM9 [Enteropsectra breve]|nr:DNA helicase MCM9 [Enteropsectra breve]
MHSISKNQNAFYFHIKNCISDKIHEYFQKFTASLRTLMSSQSETNGDTINLIELCDNNPELANTLVKNAAANPLLIKKFLTGIPQSIYVNKPISTKLINRVICTKGSIIKQHQVLFKNVACKIQCLKCGNETLIGAEDSKKKKDAHACLTCGSTCTKVQRDFNEAISSQWIRIQDIGNSRAMSETTEILIEGALAGKFIPGDKVAVTGIVMRKWKAPRPNEQMISTLYVHSLSVTKENDKNDAFLDTEHFFNAFSQLSIYSRRKILLDSFAPELSGLINVRYGLLLALVGGSSDALRACRSNIHILLVGDPATGKSHLLKMALKLVSPAIAANGVGTSDAGLTSCAVHQGKEWALEAGALVLADLGICCIDEFNRLKVNEKSGLLESMEQQTISVAKAGIVTSLNTRCSIIAAASTKKYYDSKKNISENLSISTPLVSRFDLIFGMFDIKNDKEDMKLADKILERSDFLKLSKEGKWPTEVLKVYISECRMKQNKISPELADLLLRYYAKKRKNDGHTEYNTIRMLEGLIRLSEANSKLNGNERVTEDDVYAALILAETTISSALPFALDANRVFLDESYFNVIKTKIAELYGLNK